MEINEGDEFVFPLSDKDSIMRVAKVVEVVEHKMQKGRRTQKKKIDHYLFEDMELDAGTKKDNPQWLKDKIRHVRISPEPLYDMIRRQVIKPVKKDEKKD